MARMSMRGGDSFSGGARVPNTAAALPPPPNTGGFAGLPFLLPPMLAGPQGDLPAIPSPPPGGLGGLPGRIGPTIAPPGSGPPPGGGGGFGGLPGDIGRRIGPGVPPPPIGPDMGGGGGGALPPPRTIPIGPDTGGGGDFPAPGGGGGRGGGGGSYGMRRRLPGIAGSTESMFSDMLARRQGGLPPGAIPGIPGFGGLGVTPSAATFEGDPIPIAPPRRGASSWLPPVWRW